MQKLLNFFAETSTFLKSNRHSPYEITQRYKDSSSQVNPLADIYRESPYSEYISAIRYLPLNNRIDLLEQIYTRPLFFQKESFPKIILDPFVGDLDSASLKNMNLRLSYIYVKWLNIMQRNYVAHNHEDWKPFFNKHAQYYLNNWKDNLTDYLMSLYFSYNGLHYSKESEEIIMKAISHVTSTGLPSEIPCRSDAHRALMQKSRCLRKLPSISNFYNKIAIPYFQNLDGIEEGKLVAVTLEFALLCSSMETGIDDCIKNEICKDISKAIRKASENNPDYMNSLLHVVGYRLNGKQSIDIITRMLAKSFSKFDQLNVKGLIGYTRMLSHSYSPIRYFIRGYIDALDKALVDDEVRWELFEPWQNFRKRHALPVKIQNHLSNMLNEFRIIRPENMPAKAAFSALNYYLKRIEYNPENSKRILQLSRRAGDGAYLWSMLYIGSYYSKLGKYNDLEFWNNFLDTLQKTTLRQNFNLKMALNLYSICLFVKEDNIIDFSSLIDKDALKRIELQIETMIKSNYMHYLSTLRASLSQNGITDAVLFSPEYWYLPAAIPSRKIGFTANWLNFIYDYNSISRLVSKYGWKIFEIAPHGFKTKLEADKYVKKVLAQKQSDGQSKTAGP